MVKEMTIKTLDALIKRVIDNKLEYIEFNGVKIQKVNHNYSDINNMEAPKVELSQEEMDEEILFGSV